MLACAGCGVLSPEEQVLTRFFAAAGLHDTTMLARVATVDFNPRIDGSVERFEVVRTSSGASDTERIVTLEAAVRRPDGASESRQMEVTLRPGADGRLRVTAWTFRPPRASRSGRGASSAPPT